MILLAQDKGITLTLHQGFAQAVLIYSAILAVWGLFLFLRGSNPSGSYLGALAIAEGLVVIQGLVGIVLLGQGHRPHDGLHLLYGVVGVLSLPIAYFYAGGTEDRQASLIFALAALFMIGVAIRATMTGGG